MYLPGMEHLRYVIAHMLQELACIAFSSTVCTKRVSQPTQPHMH
jgi:hypothetical protein